MRVFDMSEVLDSAQNEFDGVNENNRNMVKAKFSTCWRVPFWRLRLSSVAGIPVPTLAPAPHRCGPLLAALSCPATR